MSELSNRYTCNLPVPPERVWRALTEPAELSRWFAEHAEVEGWPGGAYRFWGRHTYGAPSRSDATQTLVRFEPAELLSYSWQFDDKPSEVTCELSPADSAKQPDGTRLEIRHVFAAAPATVRAKDLINDLWRLHGGNLLTHVSGRDGLVLPDFDDPSPAIRLSIRIDAPRDKVFRALLDPAVMNQWIASAAEVEARQGGRYSYGWSYKVDGREVVGGPRRILELVENEKLVTDWPDWRGDESVPVQTITWQLEDEAGATRVTLVHSGFVRAADWSDYPFGWGEFLAALEKAVVVPAA